MMYCHIFSFIKQSYFKHTYTNLPEYLTKVKSKISINIAHTNKLSYNLLWFLNIQFMLLHASIMNLFHYLLRILPMGSLEEHWQVGRNEF